MRCWEGGKRRRDVGEVLGIGKGGGVLYPLRVSIPQRANITPTSVSTEFGIIKWKRFTDFNESHRIDSLTFEPQRLHIQLFSVPMILSLVPPLVRLTIPRVSPLFFVLLLHW